MSFETEIVKEGLAEIEVPKVDRPHGPGRRSRLPFYNPLMRTNRDVTILITMNELHDGARLLDGLAATGVSGIRIALEADQEFEITLNDRNPTCRDLILSNIKRNEARGCTATNEDLNCILARHRFDFVDVDPFGAPVRFVEGALCATANGGIVGITATDTPVLCGSRKRACVRRYDSIPRKTEYCHELGLRILLGYIARVAARFDRGIEPLLCFSTDHYFRAIVRVRKGAGKANETLRRLGYLHEKGLERRLLPEAGIAGPLWSDVLLDSCFLGAIRLPSHFPHKVSRLLDLWREEALSPPLFYTTSEVAKGFLANPPAIDDLIAALKDRGFLATRTHFKPDAFKTNADIETLEKVVRT
ncbi:MAG: tRNA (guanine(10)-N(2))-dimethyltransferase [Thermoplasmata archaeon]